MSVDYDELERGLEVARQAFPHAEKVVPVWTPSHARTNVHVEVWANRRAVVIPIIAGVAITPDNARALMPAAC